MGRKIGRQLIILSLILIPLITFVGIPVAQAYVAPNSWSDPKIFLRDMDDTPGGRGSPGNPPLDPWYDDAKGHSGQPDRELLYVYIDWDETYIYVRWDVEAAPDALDQIRYVLNIDAKEPFSPAELTHRLQFEVNQAGAVTITIRNASDANTILWTGSPADYSITSIPPEDPNISVQTALEARFPIAYVQNEDSGEIWLTTAEAHDGQGESYSEGMDYIILEARTMPWFTDLAITLLGTTILVAFLKKKTQVFSRTTI